jgi:hypothetical protein
LVPRAELLLLPQAGHNDLQNFPAYGQALSAAMRQPITATPGRD